MDEVFDPFLEGYPPKKKLSFLVSEYLLSHFGKQGFCE